VGGEEPEYRRSLGLMKRNECVNVKSVHKSSNLGIWMEKINE